MSKIELTDDQVEKLLFVKSSGGSPTLREYLGKYVRSVSEDTSVLRGAAIAFGNNTSALEASLKEDAIRHVRDVINTYMASVDPTELASPSKKEKPITNLDNYIAGLKELKPELRKEIDSVQSQFVGNQAILYPGWESIEKHFEAKIAAAMDPNKQRGV